MLCLCLDWICRVGFGIVLYIYVIWEGFQMCVDKFISDGVCSSSDDRAAVVKGTWTFDYKLTRFLPRRGIPRTHKLMSYPTDNPEL